MSQYCNFVPFISGIFFFLAVQLTGIDAIE